MQRTQLGSGIQTQFVGEQFGHPTVGGECLVGSVQMGQRRHPLSPQSLAERVAPDHRLEVDDRSMRHPEPEQHVDPQLLRLLAEFCQAREQDHGHGVGHDRLEGFTAPQGQPDVDLGQARRRIAGVERRVRAVNQPLEPERVDLVRIHRQPVAAAVTDDDRRRPSATGLQHVAEPPQLRVQTRQRHVDVQPPGGADQVGRRHPLTRPRREDAQQGGLLGGPQVYRRALDLDRKRSKVHDPHPTILSGTRIEGDPSPERGVSAARFTP